MYLGNLYASDAFLTIINITILGGWICRFGKNEIQIVMQGERTLCTDPRTPNLLVQSMNGKESHIRKSLRTIERKLINGSERRNQRNVTEARSLVRGSTTCIKNGVLAIAANTRTQNRVLAIAANTRTLRRQSLTGAGSDQSRRSSLGGKSTNSNVKDTRNAKTPPPVHPSSTIAKRWL
ncbi:kinesin-like protein KIN-14A [Eucalyptus grandis]|uniref:kinesin-like protein KIN-14A n=1 Tax=Eucalyptus grandis TaxID=71139 RepID=UPI00192EC43E|nr:kinesin-like protein KIN-14A [Eucalyptus grandis]